MAVIIYWSGTGNTESIANRISRDKGINALLVAEASASDVANSDVVLLGCPAMGAEELEDTEFLPFYESIKKELVNKKVLIFGSYGWGDGEWIRLWKSDLEANGVNVVASLPVNGGESDIDEAEYLDFIASI